MERSHFLRLVQDIEREGLAALATHEQLRAEHDVEHKRRLERQATQMQRLQRQHLWFWFF